MDILPDLPFKNKATAITATFSYQSASSLMNNQFTNQYVLYGQVNPSNKKKSVLQQV